MNRKEEEKYTTKKLCKYLAVLILPAAFIMYIYIYIYIYDFCGSASYCTVLRTVSDPDTDIEAALDPQRPNPHPLPRISGIPTDCVPYQ